MKVLLDYQKKMEGMQATIEEFREEIYKRVRQLHVQKYPYNDFLYNVEDTYQ